MNAYTTVSCLFNMLFSLVLFIHFLKWQSDVDLSQNYRNRANLKSFSDRNGQMPSSQKPTISNHRRFLGRSLSQKDLLKSNDGYSVRFFHLIWLRAWEELILLLSIILSRWGYIGLGFLIRGSWQADRVEWLSCDSYDTFTYLRSSFICCLKLFFIRFGVL